MKSWFFGLAMAVVSATSVQAATVTATSNSTIGSFTATYTDLNSNGLWDLSEITAFSGFSYAGVFWDRVVQLGAVAGISASSTSQPNEASFGFQIADLSTLYVNKRNWRFSVAQDMPAVPLPAGMPLLLAGVGALAALRRRRARG